MFCVFVCVCTHTHTHTHIYSGACPGDLAFFRPTRTKIGVRLCLCLCCVCAQTQHKHNTNTNTNTNTSTRGLVLGTWHFFPTDPHRNRGPLCLCVFCVFVCVLCFFSQVRPSRVFWPYSRTTASPPLFNRSAELRNFLLPGWHIKPPISRVRALSRVFFFFWSYYLLTRRQPARQPYSIIPQLSCGILCCCWFFCHIKPPISPSTGPLACRDLLIYAAAKILPPPPNGGLSRVLVLLTDRQPYLIIPQSCGICQGGRLLSSPYLAEYGQYTWEGFNVKKQNKTK